MKRKFLIRHEQQQDIDKITDLILLAFYNHPHHDPEIGITEHLIVKKLRELDALALSLVAIQSNQVIGHVAFSPITIDGSRRNWHVMAPVSVLPDYQNQCVGTELVKEGLLKLQQMGSQGAVVLGEPNYYTRFGFNHNHQFSVTDVPKSYFMALSFSKDNGSQLGGNIAFHHAFTDI